MSHFVAVFVLFAPSLAQSTETFWIEHDEDSVVLGPVCVPAISGQGWFALDFDTTSLNITVAATGPSGAYTTFDYSGGNIDDGPGDHSWGNPTTSAIEVDAIATGALSGCVSLSFRDEVFAVANAEKFTVTVTDGESAIMDHEVEIFTADSIWDTICEDGGGTNLTCRELMSLVAAEALGTADYNPTATTWTVSDPSGNEQRFIITYGTDNGDRTSVTVTPVTP